MLPTLTVIESLRFAARLKLPPDLPAAAREAEVELTLRRLGLERVRDSLVGDGEQRGVSFGERRRLNIAIERSARPPSSSSTTRPPASTRRPRSR